MYKDRFKLWGLTKNMTKPLLKMMIRFRLLNYTRGLGSIFYHKRKPVDLDHECRRRGISQYEIHDEAPFEMPHFPCTIKVIHPPDLPMTQALTPSEMFRHKENILRLIREVCLVSRQFDNGVTDFWILTRGQAGRGTSNRLKDSYLNRGTELLSIMHKAAIDELVAELRQPFKLGPLGPLRLVFGNSRWKDSGLTFFIWRTIASQTAAHLPEGHPLSTMYTELEKLLNMHGHQTFLELLHHCAECTVEEMEKHYGHEHPYVLEGWLYVVRYCEVDRERLVRLLPLVQAKLKRALKGSHEDISLTDYGADMCHAANLPGRWCKAFVDNYLRGVQNRAENNKEQRQSRVTIALAHYRVFDLGKNQTLPRHGPACADPRVHLGKSIEYLSDALKLPWKAGVKSRARVISWTTILEKWLREAGHGHNAELVSRCRKWIQATSPAGNSVTFVPLSGVSFRSHTYGMYVQ